MGIQRVIVKSWRAIGTRRRGAEGAWIPRIILPSGRGAGVLSIAEQHGMHDAAGPESEESCDHQRTGKSPNMALR